MAGMTLVEFLLARIAEDECDARVRADVQPAMAAVARERFGSGARRVSGTFDPRRVLAECEAKRRIVDDWCSLAERSDDQGRPLHLFDPVTSMLLKSTRRWLCALVTVYADHPDYREEWRP